MNVPNVRAENQTWAQVQFLVMSDSWQPHGLYPARLLCPWDSPGKNTGVGCHALPQGSFSTQGSHPGLPQCRQILFHLSLQENPQSAWSVAIKMSTGVATLFSLFYACRVASAFSSVLISLSIWISFCHVSLRRLLLFAFFPHIWKSATMYQNKAPLTFEPFCKGADCNLRSFSLIQGGRFRLLWGKKINV